MLFWFNRLRQPLLDGDGNNGGGNPPADDKKFSQADVDRILGERLSRQKEQYKDYDDLKAKATKFDEEENKKKTDLEKLQAEKAESDKKLSEITARVNERTIKADVKVIASELGIVDPEAAYALVEKSGITITDDGTVTGAKEALQKLIEAKPYLKKTGTTVPTTPNPPGGGDKTITNKELSDMPFDKYREWRKKK